MLTSLERARDLREAAGARCSATASATTNTSMTAVDDLTVTGAAGVRRRTRSPGPG